MNNQNWVKGKELHLTFQMEQGFATKPVDFFTLDVSVNMFAPDPPLDEFGNAKVSAFKNTVFGGISDDTIDFGHVVQGARHGYGANNGTALQAVGNSNQFKVKLKRDPNDDQYNYDKYTVRLVFQATTKLTFLEAAFI